MDGILIDSEPLWRRAMIEVFPDVGIELDDDMCRATMGLPMRDVAAYWFERRPWDRGALTPDALAERTIARVVELVRTVGEPQPGVANALEVFATRGVPVALASSSDYVLIDAIVDSLDVHDAFVVRHSAEEEDFGKPHPSVYITAANKLGVAPENCVAIEDSPNGVVSAKAARMRCVAIPDPGVHDDPAFGLADVVLDSLELLDTGVLDRLEA